MRSLPAVCASGAGRWQRDGDGVLQVLPAQLFRWTLELPQTPLQPFQLAVGSLSLRFLSVPLLL